MAAAAAVAAATRAIRETADKQFDSTLKTVEPLLTDFSKFWRQLKSAENRNSWHHSILDQATAEPVIADPDNPTDAELKFTLDKKNVFHILIDRTMKHKVGRRLENCTMGDGRQASKITYEFHHRKTTAGVDVATNQFYGATMENTDTSIVEWISIIHERANILSLATGTAVDDKAKVVRLLGGLLTDFKDIRVILQRTANLDFETASDELIDYADTEKLMDTTYAGHKKSKSTLFSLDDKSRQPCRGYAEYRCRYRSHRKLQKVETQEEFRTSNAKITS